MKQDIFRLRSEGKSYRQIEKELGCSRSTISYHLGDGQKEKHHIRVNRLRTTGANIVKTKLLRFKSVNKEQTKKLNKRRETVKKALKDKHYDFITRNSKMSQDGFSIQEAIDFIGDNPICYLTGDKIDLLESKKYNFDHKIPASRGGDNSLSNLGICTKEANMSKNDMTVDEYLELCKKVLEHNGYKVDKL